MWSQLSSSPWETWLDHFFPPKQLDNGSEAKLHNKTISKVTFFVVQLRKPFKEEDGCYEKKLNKKSIT
jgi:hypothetical protein